MTRALVAAAGPEHRSTRDEIVRAAADCLLVDGYAATTMRGIAARAGVAVGNVQYYFPAKSDLLVEAWRELTDRSVEELRAALAQVGDPAELFQVGPDAIWAALRQLADIQLAAFDLLVQAPRRERLKAYLPELFDRYRQVIQEQLDRFERSGSFRLTAAREVLVPLVLNTVLGFGLYYVVTGDDESCLRALGAFQQLAPGLVARTP
ncbi:MAG: TetR/AcrR family transcriptional regulator [Candidatus Dormibacterales bacterium]